MTIHNERCFADYIGALWLVQPSWLSNAVSQVQSGLWKPEARVRDEDERDERAPDTVVRNGVAIIPISGPTMKQRSKFGGTSTIDARRQIREAARSERVQSIMLHIDSPGGAVPGTQELANEVLAAREHKRVVAHVDDLGASAAYWVASQTERITANEMAFVGSIGVLAVLEDTSGMADMMGIKVHAIASGSRKGDGVPGTEVSDEAIQAVQDKVDAVAEIFKAAVASGRGMSRAAVDEVADGDVRMAKDARKAGLVDQVMSFEQAFDVLAQRPNQRSRSRRQRAMQTGKYGV